MNRHHRVLEQWVESPSVRHGGDLRPRHEHLERIRPEDDQAQEKRLCDGHRRNDVGNHVPVPPPAQIDGHERVRCSNPTPKQQGAFLSAPPSGDLVQQVEVGVRTRRDVIETEIVGQDAVQQDRRGRAHHQPGSQHRALRTQLQEGILAKLAGQCGNSCVQREQKTKQDR